MRGFERRSEHYAITAGALLAAVLVIFSPAFAQEPPPGSVGKAPERTAAGSENWHELPAGGAAPRTADGHPDLNGVWFPNSAGRQVQRAYPIDPAARRQFDPKVTPEERALTKPGTEDEIQEAGPLRRLRDSQHSRHIVVGKQPDLADAVDSDSRTPGHADRIPDGFSSHPHGWTPA